MPLKSLCLMLFCSFLFAGDDAAEIRKIIESQNKKFIQTLIDEDAEAHAALFTQDAVTMFPGAPMVKGRDAIYREKLTQFNKVRVIDGVIKTERVEASGDLAYEIAYFSYTLKINNQPSRIVGGKTLVVWKRQADGRWLIQVDSGLPDS